MYLGPLRALALTGSSCCKFCFLGGFFGEGAGRGAPGVSGLLCGLRGGLCVRGITAVVVFKMLRNFLVIGRSDGTFFSLVFFFSCPPCRGFDEIVGFFC